MNQEPSPGVSHGVQTARQRFIANSQLIMELAKQKGLELLPSVDGPYLRDPASGAFVGRKGTAEFRAALGIPLEGVPTNGLKAAVLDRVYDANYIRALSGFQFLAAQHLQTNVGIFVVAGNFGRDHFKTAVSEAKEARLNACRWYVYGQTATYSGNGICFCKFEEIGIDMERASA